MKTENRLTKVKEQLLLYYIEKNYDKVECNPFLKWPGGKRQLLKELLNNLPKEYNRYFEPFVGGGALFFKVKPELGYISDIFLD